MQIFPVGRVYDFMGSRRLLFWLSTVLVLGSVALLFVPGPRLGTDFKGGTEIEVAFERPVTDTEIRSAVSQAGFSSPDVIAVEDENNPYRFLVRVQEVATIAAADQKAARSAFCFGEEVDSARCPEESRPLDVKFSPGGDKVSLRYGAAPDLGRIRAQASTVSALKMRDSDQNIIVTDARDHKVELLLSSQGARLMGALREGLGAEAVPDAPLRIEWVGPKAGAQLRNSALKAIAIALVFVMIYIAFRFDLRFAPGAVIALIHDSLVTIGILTLMQREIALSTVAAVLTIVGYSVNDTVVVYDRVRENLGKLRGQGFLQIINVSLSEMLSRTLLTSGTTIFALLAFFVWGTGTLKDFALTLIIGILLGTYSSIYVALPLTSYLDRRFFRAREGSGASARRSGPPKKKEAAVV